MRCGVAWCGAVWSLYGTGLYRTVQDSTAEHGAAHLEKRSQLTVAVISTRAVREFRKVVFEDVGFEHDRLLTEGVGTSYLKLIWVRGWRLLFSNPTS